MAAVLLAFFWQNFLEWQNLAKNFARRFCQAQCGVRAFLNLILEKPIFYFSIRFCQAQCGIRELLEKNIEKMLKKKSLKKKYKKTCYFFHSFFFFFLSQEINLVEKIFPFFQKSFEGAFYRHFFFGKK